MELYGNGQFTQCEPAVRLLTVQGEHNPVSYWQHGEEVYRLQEYEPVQFDIYGLPMGARWETNVFLWPDLEKMLKHPNQTWCKYCGKAIWLDTEGWRHESSGSLPICNSIPEPK